MSTSIERLRLIKQQQIKKSGLFFHSQQGEDTIILKNFINKPCNDGFFVELGAMDGLTYSNTHFFEKKLGFKGLLIEPTENFHQLITNRPSCINVQNAVGYNDGEKVEFIGEGAVAGMTSTMSENFRNHWHQKSKIYEVTTKRMGTILKENNVKYIDLFSIDVEGGELVVLETMDWNIPVYCIVIELDGTNKEKDEKCRDILISNGFTFVSRVSINEFWINKNYFRKDLLYDANNVKSFNLNSLCFFPYMAPHLRDELLAEFNKTYTW
jgi:FkbM family methyltransferase